MSEARKKIVEHLTKQKSRAADDGGCRYRTEDGKMCAVGCLIPDALYSPEIEGVSVDMFQPCCTLGATDLGKYLQGLDITMEELHEWQSYHDSVATSNIVPRFGVMVYNVWVNGDALHSPENFAKLMEAKYG